MKAPKPSGKYLRQRWQRLATAGEKSSPCGEGSARGWRRTSPRLSGSVAGLSTKLNYEIVENASVRSGHILVSVFIQFCQQLAELRRPRTDCASRSLPYAEEHRHQCRFLCHVSMDNRGLYRGNQCENWQASNSLDKALPRLPRSLGSSGNEHRKARTLPNAHQAAAKLPRPGVAAGAHNLPTTTSLYRQRGRGLTSLRKLSGWHG